jgi:hypothetical protein
LSPDPQKLDTVESLEASIGNINEAKVSAIQQIEELKSARQLAAFEENDAAFIHAERRLASATLFIEKCDDELPALHARLEEARRERRQTAWRDFAQQYVIEFQKFIDLYRQTLAARGRAAEIRKDAGAAGFGNAVQFLPTFSR